MGPLQLSPADQPNSRVQVRSLTELLACRDLSAREVARRSLVIANEVGDPELAAGHQAVSAWLNGTRHPNTKHKHVLSIIVGVPVADITLACGPEQNVVAPRITLRETTVVVPSSFQEYRYTLALKKEIDLKQPAIYLHWGEMFSFPPTHLVRHLRNVQSKSFGWIPDTIAHPMVHYPRCLVPLVTMANRRAMQNLDSAESSQRRVWFVHLPGGDLHVGIGYRQNRSFFLTRNVGNRLVTENFPLSRVDLVGHFTGKVVFYLLPPNPASSPRETANGNGAVNSFVTH